MKKKKEALLLALFYVGVGTVSVFGVFPKAPFYNDYSVLGLLITFPVSILSFVYRFSESNSLIPVLIIQSIMLYITYRIALLKLIK